MNKIILALFLLFASIYPIPVQAGLVDEAAASAVKFGLINFVYYIGDTMMDISGNNNESAVVDRTQSMGIIFTILTLNINPYELAVSSDWWGLSIVIYAVIAMLFILYGAARVMLARIFSDEINSFDFRKYLKNVLGLLITPPSVYILIFLILQLNFILTSLIASKILALVPPTPDNLIVYLFMGLAVLLVGVAMGIRQIMIFVYTLSGVVLAALYFFEPLQETMENTLSKFIMWVFMQPVLLFVGAAGVLFISVLPPWIPMVMQVRVSALVGLAFVLIYIAYQMVFGTVIISKLKYVLLRVATA
jgi:hypothetical protein